MLTAEACCTTPIVQCGLAELHYFEHRLHAKFLILDAVRVPEGYVTRHMQLLGMPIVSYVPPDISSTSSTVPALNRLPDGPSHADFGECCSCRAVLHDVMWSLWTSFLKVRKTVKSDRQKPVHNFDPRCGISSRSP